MNYLPKNRSKQRYFKQISILFGVFLFGLFIFSLFDAVIISIFSPVWKAENVVSRSLMTGVEFFSSKKTLIEENAALKEKLSSLELQMLFLSASQSQAGTILELAGRRQNPDTVIASVLTHPPQTPYDVIVIDAGTNESIKVGSEVVLPEGPGLGVVSDVFSRNAKVELFSHSGRETNAVLERDNVPIMLTGTGGGNFKFTLPRDITVEQGDRIFSADINSRLVAIVEEISAEPTDSFKEVIARSPVNIFTLRFVFVTP